MHNETHSKNTRPGRLLGALLMGTHGRTGMGRVVLGSVAERVLRSAPCPVLTVRAAEEPTRKSK